MVLYVGSNMLGSVAVTNRQYTEYSADCARYPVDHAVPCRIGSPNVGSLTKTGLS